MKGQATTSLVTDILRNNRTFAVFAQPYTWDNGSGRVDPCSAQALTFPKVSKR